MDKRGFSLIELLIVIALIGILVSAATFGFTQYSKKSKMESQTRAMYGDLMEYRAKALYEKRNWSFKISGTNYGIYSSATTTVAPVTMVNLKYDVQTNNANDIVFDTQGGLSELSGFSSKSVCIASANDAAFDSIVISQTRIQTGKKGTSCVANQIDAQ